MPFCGVLQFAVLTFRSGFGRVDQGQQPVWGVGRLRLSFLGIAEPQCGKRSDLRLFLCLYKNWRSSLLNWGETP